jgi:hypothetical protein
VFPCLLGGAIGLSVTDKSQKSRAVMTPIILWNRGGS